MSNAPAPQFDDDDFSAIERTVLESARGRWFLAEYARRNRHADTQVLVTAIARIEQSVQEQREHSDLDRFRTDLVEMSSAISDMRAQIAALRVAGEDGPTHFDLATNELDAIVQTTESATTDILAAAEAVQDSAWTLREYEMDAELCDSLDREATNIYTACSFQDLTAQRTRKVIEVLRYVEGRINAMIEIWGFSERSGPAAPNLLESPEADPTLSQSDIDFVLVEDGLVAQAPVTMDADRQDIHPIGHMLGERGQISLANAAENAAPPRPRLAASTDLPAPRGAALADIDRLSPAEKVALFL